MRAAREGCGRGKVEREARRGRVEVAVRVESQSRRRRVGRQGSIFCGRVKGMEMGDCVGGGEGGG